jgi:hypothetical protein
MERDARLGRDLLSQFEFLVHEHPTFALNVMTVMAEGLRRANDRE